MLYILYTMVTDFMKAFAVVKWTDLSMTDLRFVANDYIMLKFEKIGF